MEVGSREVCKAAIQIALTDSREEEIEMKAKNKENGILSVAVDFGSDFGSAVPKVLERAVVAAKCYIFNPCGRRCGCRCGT